MHYYAMKEANDRGVHVVHGEECQFLPNEENRVALGDYAGCDTAMDHARDEYDAVDGCRTCCSECHSGD